MIIRNRALTYILLTVVLTIFSCKPEEDTDSMQLTEGYPFTTDLVEINDILEYRGIDTIDFKSGQVIADIGAANGYLEAMLAMFNDSLTFYIQDIDSSVCNKREIGKVIDFYQEVNGKKFNSEFLVIIGTDTETMLPENSCDKIFMLWTYQYLKQPKVFIKDLKTKLKDDGLFYVINPTIEESDFTISLREKHGWNVSPLEKQIDDILSCGLELVRISRSYNGGEYEDPVLMIFKKSGSIQMAQRD